METGQGGPHCEADRSSRGRVRPARLPESIGGPSALPDVPGRTDGHSRGSVTAEVAVVLPALVVLLALLLGTASIGTVQLRLEEAARAGAREVMRGETDESVEQTVQRLAGSTALVTVSAGPEWTTVDVRATVEGPVVGLLGLELRATASGRIEHSG